MKRWVEMIDLTLFYYKTKKTKAGQWLKCVNLMTLFVSGFKQDANTSSAFRWILRGGFTHSAQHHKMNSINGLCHYLLLLKKTRSV